MKITFLGTGTSQGVPVITCNCPICTSNDSRDKRLRSSVMLETQGKVIVIDTGPDFRQQMLRENVKQLDAVILTHEHKDHIAGLDDIRAFNFYQKKPMNVYANKLTVKAIQREFAYSFEKDKYPGVPKINLHTIYNKEFEIEGIKIQPIEVQHWKLKIFGYRINDFTYITDANFISDTEKEKIRTSKIVVINALRTKKHYSHFNLSEAIAFLEEIKPKQGFLTHASHYLGLHKEVQKSLPKFITLAYDGLKINM